MQSAFKQANKKSFHFISLFSHSLLTPLCLSSPTFIQHSFSAGQRNITTSRILSYQLSDCRQRWKKITQTKCHPKYHSNSMTFRYRNYLAYCCFLPVFLLLVPSACKTAASSSRGRLGIPPCSKNQTVSSPLARAKDIHKAIYNLKSTQFSALSSPGINRF